MTTPKLRSQHWFGGIDLNGFLHRAWIKAEGFSEDAFQGRPVIGIANSWSERERPGAGRRRDAMGSGLDSYTIAASRQLAGEMYGSKGLTPQGAAEWPAIKV
jgi:hypothetical protein